MVPAIPLHKNDGLNSVAFLVTLVAGITTVIYLFHQTKLLRLHIAKHDEEMKLLALQIADHEKKTAPVKVHEEGKVLTLSPKWGG